MQKKIRASAFPISRKLLCKEVRSKDYRLGAGGHLCWCWKFGIFEKKVYVEAKVFVTPWTLFIFTSSSIFEKNNDIKLSIYKPR
jgi:hypothetical protein